MKVRLRRPAGPQLSPDVHLECRMAASLSGGKDTTLCSVPLHQQQPAVLRFTGRHAPLAQKKEDVLIVREDETG